MRRLFLIVFFVPLISFSQSWQPLPQTDSITFTYRDLNYNKKYKPIKGHIQMRLLPEATWVVANDFDKLPKFFKRLVIQSGNKSYSIRLSQSLSQLQPLLDSMIYEQAESPLFFTEAKLKKERLKTYPHDRDKFFAGAKGGLFLKHNWIPLYILPLSLSEPITLKVSSRFASQALYRTDQLPVSYAWRLPAMDQYNCTRFDRFRELRKMKGYGIEKIKYTPYRIADQQVIRHSFEIYFEKNQTDAQPQSVQNVIDFLKANNYSILNVSIEGYSSLEGTEEANERLQRKRAYVLLTTLRTYNNQPISSDTLIVNHGYDLFRQAIRGTPHQWLDTLSNETLRTLLNTNVQLLTEVEPFIREHRKASLKLAVAKKLNDEEMLNRFKLDLALWEARLDPKQNKGFSLNHVEPRVAGMLSYLFDLLLAEHISESEFNQLVEQTQNRNLIRVLLAYHQIMLMEKSNLPDSIAWNNYVKTGAFANTILTAHTSLIELINKPGAHIQQEEKFKAQLVDIQSYLFEYVRNGWVSLKQLCSVDYPLTSKFGGYKLRQLAFLQEMAQVTEVPCEPLVLTQAQKPKTYSDTWLDDLLPEERIFTGAVRLADGRYLPNYGQPMYSPFMFFLKSVFLRKQTGIRQFVIASDALYEFDIYILAKYNINHWQPEQNFFRDSEVLLEDMNKLIGMLKRNPGQLCPAFLNQLYLDYHLKALHYLTLYYEPGNPKHTEIVQQSLGYISRHYSQHAALVTPRLSLYILHQLNAFYALPGQYDSPWHAWNLLKSIKAKRALTPDEEVLLEKYAMYFDKTKQK